MPEGEDIVKTFNHRVNLMDSLSKEITSVEDSNDRKTLSQKDFLEKEINAIKAEFDELSSLSKELIKAVYSLGKTLKDKASTKELEAVKEKLDSWQLEEYMTKHELEEAFNFYSKK